jgi:hypothetical protein
MTPSEVLFVIRLKVSAHQLILKLESVRDKDQAFELT